MKFLTSNFVDQDTFSMVCGFILRGLRVLNLIYIS